VLVRGGYILTAAHCVEWSAEGGMALGDYHFEPVETADGRKFLASVEAVEPVADIAVLGPIDGQVLSEECDAFDQFADAVEGLTLLTRARAPDTPIPVQVLTHKGEWIRGTVTRYGVPGDPPDRRIWLSATSQIEGGTSGGPVIDDRGRLVGVVSSASIMRKEDDRCDGMIPFAWFALPRWLADRVNRERAAS
jgi:S1-C subfamily serine protease